MRGIPPREGKGAVPLCGNDRTALALGLDSREAAAVMQAAGLMLLEHRHQPKGTTARTTLPPGAISSFFLPRSLIDSTSRVRDRAR